MSRKITGLEVLSNSSVGVGEANFISLDRLKYHRIRIFGCTLQASKRMEVA